MCSTHCRSSREDIAQQLLACPPRVAARSCLDSAPQLDDQTRQVVTQVSISRPGKQEVAAKGGGAVSLCLVGRTQGAAALHQDLASKVASSLSLFVELCKSHVAAPPLPINLPQVRISVQDLDEPEADKHSG